MGFIFAVVLVLTCTSALADVDYAQFEQWMTDFDIQIEDPARAFLVWKENAEYVLRHNSLTVSYKLALNHLAHLTPSQLTGGTKTTVSPYPIQTKSQKSEPLPLSIDWRDKGAVTPVKSQGQCGSASAYAIVDSVASFGELQTGKLMDLSLEEYLDCCFNGTCSGSAFGTFAYNCIAGFKGLACASNYPVNKDHKCESDEVAPCVQVTGGAKVTPVGDEMALAEALLKQPLAVSIDASHLSFQLYNSGIYYESSCSSVQLDHAVLLVGYGTENGEDYWLIKNSWGTGWGMEGYMMMARNKNNNCGIASDAIYPK